MEILKENTVQVVVGQTFGGTGVFFGIIFIFAIIGLAIYVVINGMKYGWGFYFFLIPCFFALLLSLNLFCTKPIYKDVTEYQISAHSDITLEEFFSKYELMNQDDYILTVREKGWDTND